MDNTEKRLRAALEEIKNEQGRVCNMFELCDHVGCQSSYTSWAIADFALKVVDDDEEG